jgi:ubiquinone/menaquinone biosynthesis C-methylase UbiE
MAAGPSARSVDRHARALYVDITYRLYWPKVQLYDVARIGHVAVEGGKAQVADYDYHRRLARLLWEQQLTGPMIKADQTTAEPTAVTSTSLRQRYLRAEEFVIGLIGIALLRLSADGGLSAAERSRLADPLLQQLQEFMWQMNGRPFSDNGWEALEPRAGYGRWAASYDLASAALVAVEEPSVLALLDNLPAGLVVDAACGTGRYAAHLAAQGRNVVGVDIAAEMLAMAEARVPTGRFVVGDLCALPLATASMAGAVCGLALAHVSDLESAARELARVVRAGGHAVLSVPHPLVVALLDFKAAIPPSEANERRAYIRQHAHAVSDYLAAFVGAGWWELRHCVEPQISPTAAAALRPGFAEIMQIALVGLPAILVLELERCPKAVV